MEDAFAVEGECGGAPNLTACTSFLGAQCGAHDDVRNDLETGKRPWREFTLFFQFKT